MYDFNIELLETRLDVLCESESENYDEANFHGCVCVHTKNRYTVEVSVSAWSGEWTFKKDVDVSEVENEDFDKQEKFVEDFLYELERELDNFVYCEVAP